MEAITVDAVAVVDDKRCIGCGVCLAGCEFGAIKLYQKAPADQYVPPETMLATYAGIARERGKV
jgi:Fe-S-cluster-containing hydrogenase component 2